MSTPVAKLGRYVIESELGRGAMGIVFRARDPRIDRLVALKTLVPDVDDEALIRSVKERFLNEGRAAGRLSHPGVVAVYDADEDPATGTAYLAMEFVDGPDLRSLLREGLAPGRLIDILRQVAAALDHAHQRGVVHRDVKPANILVDAQGHARLTDFGIARLGSSTMTRAGEFLGTPAYMAPEQILGEPVGSATDTFALGVILYEGLTGKRPFAGDSMVATTHAIVNAQPVPPSQARATICPAFDGVIAKALAKKPQDRFPSAGAFAEAAAAALKGAMEATLVSAPRPGRGSLDAGGVAATRLAAPAIGSGSRRKALLLVLAALLILTPGAFIVRKLMRGDEPAAAMDPPAVEPAKPAAASGATASRNPSGATASRNPSGPTGAAATKPKASAKAPAPAPPAQTGQLAIKVTTLRAGALTVSVDGKEVGRISIAVNEDRGPKALGKMLRTESGTLSAPAGRRRLRFAFTNRDGTTIMSQHDRDIPAGGSLAISVSVGVRGRDLDVDFD